MNNENNTETMEGGLVYSVDYFTGKTATEIADAIEAWREDDGLTICAAFDLLNAIEPWLRTGGSKEFIDSY